ncbi:calmodulin-binding protein 60 D isoform X2 [Eucalyptus grandis]|uniref:calmodulin-binding protein 60 D isoform X2 n=1 Tax=Eucalyptus grandis TaxID=71139 RepID=UPI00192F0BC0|nr:calmodulin-binding protein 60 D isoform X2 [Eucalyptus grandis]
MQSCESETSNGVAGNRRPKSLLTEENPQRGVSEELELIKSHFDKMVRKVRSHFREELKLVKSHLADLVSCISNTLKEELVPAICSSLEDTVRGVVREELEHASSQSVQLVRSSGKCLKKDEVKNLQLQFKTKLPASFFTGEKLKGEHGIPIDVKLVNADTGNIIESGPESSVKLKVVVLQGDFGTDDDDSWTQEEFEKSVVRERKGKRPLLIGNLLVILNGGTGMLGELEFTDNSSWTRSKKFRLGLQVLSGYCENIHIREAITEPFNVKENRGQSNEKHDEPAPGDEVWRLKNIGRNGPFRMNLEKAGIYNVRQFRQLLDMDPEKLKKILGPTMKKNKWDKLREHAETCRLNGNPHLSLDNESDDRNGRQLTDHTADQVHCAADKFSPNQETFVNWNDGKELNDETGSMQEKGSSSFPSQVSEGQIQNLTPFQHNLAPGTCTAPVGPETLMANAGSTAEGHNGVTLALPAQSQNTNFGNALELSADHTSHLAGHQLVSAEGCDVLFSPGDNRNTTVELPIMPHDINSQCAMPSQMISSSSQMVYTEVDNFPFSKPPLASIRSFQSSTFPPLEGNHVMEGTQPIISDDSFKAWLDSIMRTITDDASTYFQTPPDDVV